jgi:hypothetical protein
VTRWLYIALAAVLGVGVAACNRADANGEAGVTNDLAQLIAPDGEQLMQLTDAELKGLLPGASWSNVPRTQYVEIFHCEGGWTLVGPRIPLSGSYSIRDNQYCVEGARGNIGCAKLFRSETGKLFVQSVSPSLVGRGFGEITIDAQREVCSQR